MSLKIIVIPEHGIVTRSGTKGMILKDSLANVLARVVKHNIYTTLQVAANGRALT